MAWFLAAYADEGGKNLGIYNCRTVRGGSTTSLHGEGRACDFGINPHGAAYGTLLADQLRLHSGELGIQCVIWNRRIWSGSYPDAGWRAYSGTNAHVDHIHLELTRAAARTLTAERVHAVLRGTTGGDWSDMATKDEIRAVLREELGRTVWETTGALPNRRGPNGEKSGSYADTLFGMVLTTEGTTHRIEMLLRQIAARLGASTPSGPLALTDADRAAIAAEVAALLSARLAS